MEPVDPTAPEPTPAPPPPPSLADQFVEKLAAAPLPLKLAEVKRGLTRPRKQSKEVFEASIQEALVTATRSGRAFAHPSGKNGEERYWARDEKHAIREEALRLAETPDALAKLVKAAGAVSKADATFAEGVVRDLIAEEKLFEHPPAKKGKNPTPRFGAHPVPPPPPPPHPLTLKSAKAPFAAFLKAARKLLDLPGVELDDLFTRTRAELSAEPAVGEPERRPEPAAATPDEPSTTPPADIAAAGELILAAIRGKPVASLADVRREMLAEYRGAAFDAAVLDLSDKQKVILYQDADPLKFTPEERAELVTDGGNLFTTISLRG